MDDSSPFDSFTSLLRLAGHQVPARALFIGETIFSGIYTGTTIGLVCGQIGIMFTPFGPLVPFMCGTGFGFCLGLYGSWKRSVDLAKTYAKFYPQILSHALWTECRIIVPKDDSFNMEQWISQQSVRHLSFCMLAALSCRNDVMEVDKLERQRLVEKGANEEDDA